VLRADAATCVDRVAQREPRHVGDPQALARQHARFADLAEFEAHVIDASRPPDAVAADVLSGYARGEWTVT
jgi:thymidylate kinase